MIRTPLLGAVLALLMSSAAMAQTDPLAQGEAPTPPAVDQIAPSAEAPLMPRNPQPEAEASASDGMDHDAMTHAGSMMDEDEEGEGMRGEGRRHGWRAREDRPRGKHHRGHWRNHHGGHGDDERGAVLSFSQGEGGPSFRIRCADGDTTLECTSAIMPMLDRLMPQQQAPAAR